MKGFENVPTLTAVRTYALDTCAHKVRTYIKLECCKMIASIERVQTARANCKRFINLEKAYGNFKAIWELEAELEKIENKVIVGFERNYGLYSPIARKLGFCY